MEKIAKEYRIYNTTFYKVVPEEKLLSRSFDLLKSREGIEWERSCNGAVHVSKLMRIFYNDGRVMHCEVLTEFKHGPCDGTCAKETNIGDNITAINGNQL